MSVSYTHLDVYKRQADMGLEESGLDRLIKECYALLGLISYLTAGKQEVRAWTIKKGTKAQMCIRDRVICNVEPIVKIGSIGGH